MKCKKMYIINEWMEFYSVECKRHQQTKKKEMATIAGCYLFMHNSSVNFVMHEFYCWSNMNQMDCIFIASPPKTQR